MVVTIYLMGECLKVQKGKEYFCGLRTDGLKVGVSVFVLGHSKVKEDNSDLVFINSTGFP